MDPGGEKESGASINRKRQNQDGCAANRLWKLGSLSGAAFHMVRIEHVCTLSLTFTFVCVPFSLMGEYHVKSLDS